jgi:hypothetical protein
MFPQQIEVSLVGSASLGEEMYPGRDRARVQVKIGKHVLNLQEVLTPFQE